MDLVDLWDVLTGFNIMIFIRKNNQDLTCLSLNQNFEADSGKIFSQYLPKGGNNFPPFEDVLDGDARARGL